MGQRIIKKATMEGHIEDIAERLRALENDVPRHSTTSGRPSAAIFPAGTPWYDTTLTIPIWSDGAIWRKADGTAA